MRVLACLASPSSSPSTASGTTRCERSGSTAGFGTLIGVLSDAGAAPLAAGHAKALLVVSETTADLIVGSLNWSTSSKANAECGLHLTVASGAPVVSDFIRDFESVSLGARRLMTRGRLPPRQRLRPAAPFWGLRR